jgi:hypothetical protein
MNFFHSSKSFEGGIPAIVIQHRSRADLINSLATSIADGAKLPVVQSLFSQSRETVPAILTLSWRGGPPEPCKR